MRVNYRPPSVTKKNMNKKTPTTKGSSTAYAQQLNKYVEIYATVYTTSDCTSHYSIHDLEPSRTSYTYSLIDITFWNPVTQSIQPLSANPDKFTIIAESPDLAKSEFYSRFFKYCVTRFGYRPKLTINNYINE